MDIRENETATLRTSSLSLDRLDNSKANLPFEAHRRHHLHHVHQNAEPSSFCAHCTPTEAIPCSFQVTPGHCNKSKAHLTLKPDMRPIFWNRPMSHKPLNRALIGDIMRISCKAPDEGRAELLPIVGRSMESMTCRLYGTFQRNLLPCYHGRLLQIAQNRLDELCSQLQLSKR